MTSVASLKTFWGPITISRTSGIHCFSAIRTLKLRKIWGVYKVLNSVKQQLKIFTELRRDMPTSNIPGIYLMAALLGKPQKVLNDTNPIRLIGI